MRIHADPDPQPCSHKKEEEKRFFSEKRKEVQLSLVDPRDVRIEEGGHAHLHQDRGVLSQNLSTGTHKINSKG